MSSVSCSATDDRNVKSPNRVVSWKEMFRSASFRTPKPDPFSVTKVTNVFPTDHALQTQELSSFSSKPEILALRSLSMDHNPHNSLNFSGNSPNIPWQAMFRTASFRRPDLSHRNQYSMPGDNAALSNTNAAHNNLIESNLLIMPLEETNVSVSTSESPGAVAESEQRSGFPSDVLIWAAIYFTLGQAVLTVLPSLSYGLTKLLEEYIRPVIWASLCSIPLRGIQDTLVDFWSEPLSSGLTDAVFAVPIAILRAFAGTIIDARDVLSWVFYGDNKKLEDVKAEKNGFLRLVRRLVSFSLFVFVYDQIGRIGALTLIGLGFIISSNLSSATISAVYTLRSDSFSRRSTKPSRKEHNLIKLDKISRVISQWVLSRLKTILAVGLIIGMIIGSLAGLSFFTYQIGTEGKDAVISIKTHIEKSNYAEKFCIRNWIHENNDAMELIDWYTSECYETLLEQIDSFASKYNLSELLEVIKQFAITPYYTDDFPENSSMFLGTSGTTKYTVTLRNLMRKPVLNKEKCLTTQGMNLWFWVLTNSKFILDGSAHFLLYIGHIMVSGGAGFVQFSLQLTVFLWVLYYLLTSESGGVTEQVMKVLPLEKPIKDRCVEALNNAISGVLLATAEIAVFQGCYTWLLCRLFSLHFAYMSTMLAFINPLLPVFPAWLPTLPGAVELMLDGRYILGISFCIIHIMVMDYGASEIAEYVPGYTTYLTGVSIIGGMTLLPSALEVKFDDYLALLLLILLIYILVEYLHFV